MLLLYWIDLQTEGYIHCKISRHVTYSACTDQSMCAYHVEYGIYYGITKLMAACSKIIRELSSSCICNGNEIVFFVPFYLIPKDTYGNG